MYIHMYIQYVGQVLGNNYCRPRTPTHQCTHDTQIQRLQDQANIYRYACTLRDKGTDVL